LILKTTEEQLALAFNHIGPFVAIARPGDELPQLGAARLSFATEQWQERVLMLLGRAQLVVLHLGSTEGFWWEVDAVLAQADLRHVLFFVPLGGGSTYQRLADLVRTRHGIEIPTVRVDGTGDKEPDAHFLHFDETGKPYLLHVWPEFWKKGIYSERAVLRSLGPVFEQFGLDRPHLPMHPYLRWLVLFLIPTALFYWNLSYQPRIREAKDRLAVVQARIGVYELSRNLERLSSSTGELPAADKWTMALDRAGLIPDSMLQGYKAHSAVLLDPWGFPYHYKVPGLRNPGGFDLFSLGADGKEGGGGISADVGNWEPNP